MPKAQTPKRIVVGPIRIPLVGGARRSKYGLSERDRIKHMLEIQKKTAHMEVTKPQRMLGAPWIDANAANRNSVSLCPTCQTKYGLWYRKFNYVAIYHPQTLAACDGCAEPWVWCASFYPAERPSPFAYGMDSRTFGPKPLGEIACNPTSHQGEAASGRGGCGLVLRL